jgi:phosphate starvation-inducible membrane PsiE
MLNHFLKFIYCVQVIQGYAVEIFADVFSKSKSGVNKGEEVDQVIMFFLFLFLTLQELGYFKQGRFVLNQTAT